MSNIRLSRRTALQAILNLPTAYSLEAQSGIPPLNELVNVFEVLAAARRKLPDEVYLSIAGTDRRIFDRMTFRPRMMVNVTKLDLTSELLGLELFAPVLIGPISFQQRFHSEGELAMVSGANAARTPMVVSSRSQS
jgi:(S)-2-hydroxy-acid oxidase